MKNFFKNAFLIIALSLVIFMIIGIYLYDYIPNGSNFAKANTYVTEAKTLKVLAEITDDDVLNDGDNLKSNVVLKEYTVTEADLSVYMAKKDYQKGKTDPFSDGSTPRQEGNSNTNLNQGSGNGASGFVQGSADATVGSQKNNTTSNSGSSSSNGSSSQNNSVTNNNVATNDGTLLNSKSSK